MKNNVNLIGGLVLAGGKSRRMNFNDKSFKKIGDSSLIEIVIERLKPQVNIIAINSNTLDNNRKFNDLVVLNDSISGYLGPLVGVLTGLEWLKSRKENFTWLITIPVDSPFFPDDIVNSFVQNLGDEKIIVAKSKEQIHPVIALWSLDLIEPLRKAITNDTRKIDEFTKKIKMKVVNFPIIDYDPFFNINNENDLLIAKKIFNVINSKGI